MTDLELQQYYSGLLILQYRQQPKATAHIEALVKQVIADQIITQVQDAFALDTAVGVQLDVIGKYAGVTRNGYNFSGPVTLNDDDFRLFIKIAIIENNAGSSLNDIQNLLHMFFEGALFVFDHQNMHMDYFVDTNQVGEPLVEFFIKAGKLPKPMGVGIGAIIAAPDVDHFFQFRTYQHEIVNGSGFNFYGDYDTGSPWLSYQDSLTV